jgi:hypothetical protein
MQASRAALGFRVKSGWAAAVVIAGSRRAPSLRATELVELSDPRHPETRQPYHARFGKLETDKAKLERRIERVRRATEKSIVDLLKDCVECGFAVQQAGLVVGSVIERPASIANPHIRAHALEGAVFRTTLEAALQGQGIRCAIFSKHDIYMAATRSLRQSPAQVKRALTELGHSVKPWRAEQKLAALAAWLSL